MGFVAVAGFLSGCASESFGLDGIMTPYISLKAIVKKSMPQGVISESVNGREMTSGYFVPTSFYEVGTDKPERVQAKVLLLGSSRPFRLEVHCYKERKSKTSGKYVFIGEDAHLSRQLAIYFRDALADRREDRNLIDDFRTF